MTVMKNNLQIAILIENMFNEADQKGRVRAFLYSQNAHQDEKKREVIS
jgi:hypothetical protein